MIWLLHGENRVKIGEEVKNILGENYEVFEAEDLTTVDLPNIFWGTSLFGTERRILVKDSSDNQELFKKLEDYLGTEHRVVLWEKKLDKRTATYKSLVKSEKLEIREFRLAEVKNVNGIFEIYETALKDGKKAVQMVEQIENTENPFGLVGLFVTQALRKYQMRYGERERRILKELAQLDMEMKSAKIEPWTLVKAFLIRLATI